jgi:hypothetical protein
MRARMSEVVAIDASVPVRDEVLRVLRSYIGFHVPARLRALDSYAAAR